MAAPIYIPTNSVGGFPFLHTLSAICRLALFPGVHTSHHSCSTSSHVSETFKNKNVDYFPTKDKFAYYKLKIIDLKYNDLVKNHYNFFHNFKHMFSVTLCICMSYLFMKASLLLLNDSLLF